MKPGLSMHTPIRSQLETDDVDLMSEHLTACYGGGVRLSVPAPVGGAGTLSHSRIDVGGFSVDEVVLTGDVEVAIAPMPGIAVLWVLDGSMELECAGIRAIAKREQLLLSSLDGAATRARTHDVHLRIVSLSPWLLAQAATASGRPVRFRGLQPVDTATAAAWREAVTFVMCTVLSDDDLATPTMLESAGRLLAGVAVTVLPSQSVDNAEFTPNADGLPVVGPAQLRGAVEFIESNAARDISVSDIAGAVYLTPRAIQYMFRRHLNTTPMAYLRCIRLRHAHHDLTVADLSSVSVTKVAMTWGFAHAGRFTSLYRQAYGQSPATTLRYS